MKSIIAVLALISVMGCATKKVPVEPIDTSNYVERGEFNKIGVELTNQLNKEIKGMNTNITNIDKRLNAREENCPCK